MTQPTNLDDKHHDDIVEEENPLPRWWVLLFIGTLIFAALYVWFFHFGPGHSQQEQFDGAMNKVKASQQVTTQPSSAGNESSGTLSADPAKIAAGKSVYDSKCAACHGPQGQGLIGPNLTDSSWIKGDGSSEAIHEVIRNGVPEKGMMAWKDLLSEADLNAVTVYVVSLAGTNPPNPKAAEGTAIDH